MRKGISGHTLVIVISLIIALLGFLILWLFLKETASGGITFAEQIIDTLKELIPKPLRWILPGI